MRTAETVLNIIRDRGRRGLPLEDLYRQLFNPDLYLRAYGKLYANHGAMTPGATTETVDAMSLAKINKIIEAVKYERYRWMPVRRTYIAKKNGKRRALGLPTWSDKLLQEVMRSLLEAYYEPQFSTHSHGFRAGHGCHTALQEITQRWRGVKWFIEGDVAQCFDSMSHKVIINTLREKVHDERFIRLIENLLKAGYMEEWHHHNTYSGTPQGGVLSPILSNLVLDRLDKFVELQLIPANTRGTRRRTNPRYGALTKAASEARKTGDRELAQQLNKQAQYIPSKDPDDPNFRRLWYVRYADDWLLGFSGPKAEAKVIKQQVADFLHRELELELSQEKTLITHARDDTARFLGYELHTLHSNTKHDERGQRCINGAMGLRVPQNVIKAQMDKYMRHGRPAHLMQRINDTPYSIVTQYQVEYGGVVQYYRLAYNLHQLSKLKHTTEMSLTFTLAHKLKISVSEVYRRYGALQAVDGAIYKVLEVKVERGEGKAPLIARFGGIPLKWNKWVAIHDEIDRVWSGRSEVVQRLLAQQCEVCGATDNIEVHHIRKLADLKAYDNPDKPQWVKIMAIRRRKTLVVCQKCHQSIHSGNYIGPRLSK